MVKKNPLDLTPSQIQNLLVLAGLGFMVFMLITQFPLDPLWAGILGFMLFGQKLVPWGQQHEISSYSKDQDNNQMANNSPRQTKRKRNDSSDVGFNKRDVYYSYLS